MTLSDDHRLQGEIDGRRLQATVVPSGDRRQVFLDGRSWSMTLVEPLDAGSRDDDHVGGLKAPMPGKVIALVAATGAVVDKGAPLLILEAMKMEHTITAPGRGTVNGFHYAAGDQVAEGVDLVDFSAAD